MSKTTIKQAIDGFLLKCKVEGKAWDADRPGQGFCLTFFASHIFLMSHSVQVAYEVLALQKSVPTLHQSAYTQSKHWLSTHLQ